jgi:hypothetical protein
MVKRKRWDSKYHQIEYRKVNLLGKALFNHLKILWFVSVEKYTYKSLVERNIRSQGLLVEIAFAI